MFMSCNKSRLVPVLPWSELFSPSGIYCFITSEKKKGKYLK